MAGLHSSIDRLDTAERLLRQRWESTKLLWNDPVSHSFEKDYLVPLDSQSKTTSQEMRNLSQVILDAYRSVH